MTGGVLLNTALVVLLVAMMVASHLAMRRAERYRKELQLARLDHAGRMVEVEALARERDRAERRAADLLDRLEHLQGQMVDMKREGFVTVEHPLVVAEPRERGATPDAVELPTAVEMAIARRGRSAALREQLAAYAREQLAGEVPAEDVARAILQGADTSHLV